MKSKKQKREEAFDRLVASEYKNSKACRIGKSKEQWQIEKQERIDKLSVA